MRSVAKPQPNCGAIITEREGHTVFAKAARALELGAPASLPASPRTKSQHAGKDAGAPSLSQSHLPFALAFAPGSVLLATERLKILAVRTFPEPGSRLTFSPDGRILAARCTNDTVKLWNVETGEEMRKLDNAGSVLCLSFSPDGQTVATGNWVGEVQLWNVVTGEPGLPIQGHTTVVWSLACSPDGQTLVSVCEHGTLRFWDAPNPDAPRARKEE